MLVYELINQGKPEDLCLIQDDRRFTYAEVREKIISCRNRLYVAGVRRGDRVGIFSRNSVEFVCAYFAIASLGAITVPINFQLSQRETAFIVDDAGIRLMLTDRPMDLSGALYARGYEADVAYLDIAECVAENEASQAPKLDDYFNEHEPCVIIYTSGTTGTPKGAVLSHHNLVTNANQMRHMKCTSEHAVLCVLPMYHCFGWTCSVLYPLLCGARVVILDSFTPRETIKVIHEEKVNDLYVVPSICSLLTKLATKEEMASLRLVVSGGTTLPLKIEQDFMEKFGVDICEGYGLSEASPVVTMNPLGKAKVGSIGPAIPDLEWRLIDNEGKDVPQGEIGELIVKGGNVMLGYWNLPEITEKTIVDGWLHTGDVGRVDEDGYIYIVDRIKDMIISMGENIYPREIEELVYTFPGIREAAVIGIEDKLRGQAGACYYSVEEDSEVDPRLLKKFLQKNLALYKIPREFHEMKELPRTSTGKIAKRNIPAAYEAEQAEKK